MITTWSPFIIYELSSGGVDALLRPVCDGFFERAGRTNSRSRFKKKTKTSAADTTFPYAVTPSHVAR